MHKHVAYEKRVRDHQLRKSIRPSSWATFMRQPGKYILAYESHFVAAKHDDNGPQLNMGRRTHEFESFVDSVVEVPPAYVSSCITRHPVTGQL